MSSATLAHAGDEEAVRGLVEQARQHWLDERRTGIGGSDAAAVCGLSPWTTPLEVYLDKIGESPDRDENDDMRRGTLLEPVVRQMYADATGRKVVVPDNMIRNEQYPWALVNLDGLTVPHQIGVECKTARSKAGWGDPGSPDIPMVYLIQVQHAMAVAKLDVFDVPVLFGTDFEFSIYTVERDRELIDMLMEREREFWAMVQSRTPPDPVTAEDVKLRWPKSRPLAAAPAAQSDVQAAAYLAAVKERMGRLESLKESLETVLKKSIADAEALDYEGETLATWKSAKGSVKFDAKRLQAEHPELYEQYLTETAGSRRFLLKEKCKCLSSIMIPLPPIPADLCLPPQAAAALSPNPASAG